MFAYENKKEGDDAALVEVIFKIILPDVPYAWKESVGIHFAGGYSGFRRGVKFSAVPVPDPIMGETAIIGVCNVTPTFGNLATGSTFFYGRMTQDLKRLVVGAIITVPGSNGNHYDVDTSDDHITMLVVQGKENKKKRSAERKLKPVKPRRKHAPAEKKVRLEVKKEEEEGSPATPLVPVGPEVVVCPAPSVPVGHEVVVCSAKDAVTVNMDNSEAEPPQQLVGSVDPSALSGEDDAADFGLTVDTQPNENGNGDIPPVGETEPTGDPEPVLDEKCWDYNMWYFGCDNSDNGFYPYSFLNF